MRYFLTTEQTFLINMPGIIVVGLQWGDEGKGKIIDLLSENATHIVRAQGGNNAGHTIMVGNQEYRFHLIPSGILHPQARCYVSGGTVIDPVGLWEEMEGLCAQGIVLEGRLLLSPYAHLILPYHRLFDALVEEQKGLLAIGTTKKGIGPCLSDKANRVGIRLGDLTSRLHLEKALTALVAIKNRELAALFNHPPLNFDELFASCLELGKKLAPFIHPVESIISQALDNKDVVLFEGAHGTFLDATFGTYPYVTSSATLAGGICSGAGIGPTRIDHTLGVVKAYTTRVGNGPLPTALAEEEEKNFMDHVAAREVGTTTGRKRRMGWFDSVLVRRAVSLNGASSIAVTKLDILDSLETVKVCIGYRLGNEVLDVFPTLTEDLENVEPIYETLPGWRTSTKDITKLEGLPKQARHYLDRIEERVGAPISIISLGPERHRTIFLNKIINKQ